MCKLDSQLQDHEVREGFDRWPVGLDTYKDMQRIMEEKEKESILRRIEKSARERLNLKVKFAGMQCCGTLDKTSSQ